MDQLTKPTSTALPTHLISYGKKRKPTSNLRDHGDYSCETIAVGLEREAELRGTAEMDVVVEEAIVKASDCKAMDIRGHLEKMDSGALHAFHVMLTNTDRTREVPDLTIDTRVCHDLCDEACLIIAFGATLGHVFSLSAFVEKLIAWCSRLAVVAAEEAEAAQKPKKKQQAEEESLVEGPGQDGGSDEELEIIL